MSGEPSSWSETLRRAAQEGLWPPGERRAEALRTEGLDWKAVGWLVAVATLGTFAVGFLAFALIEDRWPEGFFAHWNRWDSLHYLRMAEEGYGVDGQRALLAMWPPLYAWGVRLVSLLVGDALVAGIVVSTACYASATALFYRLTALDFSESVARRAVLYWSLFPTAYFLHIAYAESLFALLVLGSFAAARSGRWAAAGALGGLAALTRITWMPLLPALLVEYLLQRDFQLRRVERDIWWLALLPAGFLLFLAINYAVYGNALQFLEVAGGVMRKELAAPWTGARAIWDYAAASGPTRAVTIGAFELLAGFGALGAAVWACLRLRASYAVYLLGSALLLTCNSWWLGTLRYWLPLFPAFWMLALWGTRHRALHFVLCAVFGSVQVLLIALFVRGWWTH